MLRSCRCCRFFSTSLGRRAACDWSFEGDPYIDSGIGRPGSFDEGAISRGAAPDAPAAAIAPPPANAAVLRRKLRRPGNGSLSFDISSSPLSCHYNPSRMGKLAERYMDHTRSGVYRVTSVEIPLAAALEATRAWSRS